MSFICCDRAMVKHLHEFSVILMSSSKIIVSFYTVIIASSSTSKSTMDISMPTMSAMATDPVDNGK